MNNSGGAKSHRPSQANSALVVDDDDLTQELLREMLGDLGFSQVLCAMDGRQALKMLADHQDPPRLLLCDIFMPEMDGFEFLEKLTSLHFTGGVILMTGGDADMLIIARDIAVSKGLNVIGSFLKPVSLAHMASAMAALPS